ncbi:MAG: hypothetical protein JSU87_07420 [Gemmatimonadota bacterium]|nr:MAG: hypothetical protein JSU87_07420 [Gemmatimonadota bacterium]
MTDEESRDRRYTREEFAIVLRKALDRQERLSERDAVEGFCVEEMQAVAVELGLDPELVRQTALALPIRRPGRLAAIFGGPAVYRLDYTAAGEIRAEDFGELVATVRRAASHHGEVSHVLGSLEWKTVAEVSPIHVTITPRGGRTKIVVTADRGGAAVLVTLLGSIGWLVGFAIAGATIQPHTWGAIASLVLTAAGGSFFTVRTIWKVTTTRFQARLERVMDALAAAVERSARSS